MPIILGAGDSSSGYEISNSYRTDLASAMGLARFGNNSRNALTFTISFWVKRAVITDFQVLVTSKVEDSGVNSFLMSFTDADQLKVQGQPASGTGAGASRDYIVTNNRFRDTAAWYHIVYRQDTTQSTASNRHRLYVNGVETDNGTYAPLDQNVGPAYFYNAGSYPYAIGNDERDNEYSSFYMAEHHYTDGVSNGPDAFGEYNVNGVWIPKEYEGSYGSYGHYLKFENTGGGSGTTAIGGHNYTTGSSSTIGADSSGNDNHFHVQGYSTEDNTTDTPTNNFCTLNLLDKTSGITVSEGNTIGTANSNHSAIRSTFGLNSGKWYWENKILSIGSGPAVGVMTTDARLTDQLNATDQSRWYRNSGAKFNNSSETGSYGASYTTNDIIGIALNLDDGEITFYKNGSSQGVAFTDLLSSTDESWLPAIKLYNEAINVNFGNPSFSISSGNADANGYGNFEYAVPSGYYSICTKNIAEYG